MVSAAGCGASLDLVMPVKFRYVGHVGRFGCGAGGGQCDLEEMRFEGRSNSSSLAARPDPRPKYRDISAKGRRRVP
ncbi:hypothetical protein ACQPZX_43815 [Actinoplanes sp. CA-142083]|uniref:hypothetical protein n=1 Tax=Actinoplanes sp. CA-142083 TaxID=3239903 RepID=UPI003D8A877C